MKLLLLEYITAGGLNRESLDTSLLQEAVLMRDALLRDFSDISGLQIVTTYDARLTPPDNAYRTIAMDATSNPESVWQELLTQCEAALIVAPETSDVLSRLTQMVEAAAIKNLGSHLEAVNIASDKYDTYKLLKHANITTMPTWAATEFAEIEHISLNGFVIKPKDGAGCETTYYFAEKSGVLTWLANHPHENLIVQPFQLGMPASISALFKQGQAWVLGCNEQLVHILDGDIQVDGNNTIHFKGCRVNACNEYLADFTSLANQVAAALPTLSGYAGIDLIVDKDEINVVEINPRITTSYSGLRESLGHNPAQLILDLALNPAFDLPFGMNKNIVDVHIKCING